jgi:hypothetical protein
VCSAVWAAVCRRAPVPTDGGSDPQVSDFGLARLIALQGRINTDTYGTVTHMPPELLTGGDLSPAVVRISGSPVHPHSLRQHAMGLKTCKAVRLCATVRR